MWMAPPEEQGRVDPHSHVHLAQGKPRMLMGEEAGRQTVTESFLFKTREDMLLVSVGRRVRQLRVHSDEARGLFLYVVFLVLLHPPGNRHQQQHT